MIADNVNNLINSYITHCRTNADTHKIFKGQNKFNVQPIVTKLGLTPLGHIENCAQIIRKLILDYKYFGEYTCGQINAFLKVYEDAKSGSVADTIMLSDLQQECSADSGIG